MDDTNITQGPMKKILYVEDDDGLAEVYLTRLDAEGFEVKRVPNGEDALATALAFKPDLILLDAMMPQVNGFDVLDILRNTPETTNIKIIMLTALSQDSDRQRAEQLGADDYLVKSQVVIADVIEKIKHHLGIAWFSPRNAHFDRITPLRFSMYFSVHSKCQPHKTGFAETPACSFFGQTALFLDNNWFPLERTERGAFIYR